MYFFNFKDDFMRPEHLNEIISKKYKDTPFAVIKNKIGHMWTLYIIMERNGYPCVVEYQEYWTKKEAIKDIENRVIQEKIHHELYNLSIIDNFLNNTNGEQKY